MDKNDAANELSLALNASGSLNESNSDEGTLNNGLTYNLTETDKYSVTSVMLSSLTNVRQYAQYGGVSADILKASVRHINAVIKEMASTKKLKDKQLKAKAGTISAAIKLLVAGGITVPKELSDSFARYPSLKVVKVKKTKQKQVIPKMETVTKAKPVYIAPRVEGELEGNEKFEYQFPHKGKQVKVLSGNRTPLHRSRDPIEKAFHLHLKVTGLKRHFGKLVSLKAKKLLLAKGI